MSQNLQTLATVIGPISAVITAMITGFFVFKQKRMDSNHHLIDQLSTEVDRQADQLESERRTISSLSTQVHLQMIQITGLEVGIAKLVSQIESLGVTPAWRPEKF